MKQLYTMGLMSIYKSRLMSSPWRRWNFMAGSDQQKTTRILKNAFTHPSLEQKTMQRSKGKVTHFKTMQ